MKDGVFSQVGSFLLPWLLVFALIWNNYQQQERHEDALTQLLYGATFMTDGQVREFIYEVTPPEEVSLP